MLRPTTDTVTLLFTDIEGSTRLWEHYREPMARALKQHDEAMREVIESHGGRVFKTIGDAFCAAFTNPADAVNAAVTAQRRLPDITIDPGGGAPTLPVRVRMALHTGTVEGRDDDLFGPPVNRVGRLLSAGHGGQILMSLATEQLVRDHLPPGVTLIDLGSHGLRDLLRPERIFQIVAPGLDTEFVRLRTMESQPHNLPHQASSLVGRDRDLESARSLLNRTRLLTLTGGGGCGKTRLALQLAGEVLEEFPDGVFLVDLGSLTDGDQIASAIANPLGVREEPARALEQSVTAHLGTQRVLLVLDNAEHLITACSHICSMLLSATPHTKLLVTSREALSIPAEVVWNVMPLSTPPAGQPLSPDLLGEYGAVRLFVERAAAARPGFRLTDGNTEPVAQLCRRLDGIPLAIELAAAMVRSLGVQQINALLRDRFRLLSHGSGVVPRQQTLYAAIDWSHELLSDPERSLFRRLSVFAAGWTLEAAEAVCSDVVGAVDESGGEEPAIIGVAAVWEVLTRLADKSLVAVDLESQGEPRYSFLESVREFAAAQLQQAGEVDERAARMASYMAKLAEVSRQALRGPEQAAALDCLDRDLDNLRAALSWSLQPGSSSHEAMRLACALWYYWFLRGQFTEGRTWLERSLRAAPDADPALRSGVLTGAGTLASYQADYFAAARFHEESLDLRRTAGDAAGAASCLNNLGITAALQRRWDDARRYWEQGLEGYRALGANAQVATILNHLGSMAVDLKDFPRARELLEQSLEVGKSSGDRFHTARTIHHLGLLAEQESRYEESGRLLGEALKSFIELGDQVGIVITLRGCAALAADTGDPEGAVLFLSSAEAHAESISLTSASPSPDQLLLKEALRVRLGEDRFEKAWREGRAVPITAACSVALGEISPESAPQYRP